MAKKTNSKAKSRYQQVKDILTKAAGNSTADYQGCGQFWNTFSLEQLQECEIYGIRMIAPKEQFQEVDASIYANPETKKTGSGSFAAQNSRNSRTTSQPVSGKSCCTPSGGGGSANAGNAHSSADGTDGQASAQTSYPGRGAASGLIKGLKGEAPFDDTRFGRLPLGGSVVSAKDINFISQWIDDGCPEEDSSTPSVGKPAVHPRSLGEEDHEAHGNPNQAYEDSGTLKQRKNIQFLSDTELENFRYAINELIQLNQYPLATRSFNYYAQLHGDMCQHGWEQFLPWHRAYLHEFEMQLQDVIPSVTLPYWDWTLPMYQDGVVPTGGVSGIIPTAYRCWLSQAALDNLVSQNIPGFTQAKADQIKQYVDIMYNSGTELIWNIEDTIGPMSQYLGLQEALTDQLKLTNPLWNRLRFPGMFYEKDDNGNYILKNGRPQLITDPLTSFHHQYPTVDEVNGILALNNWPDFGGGAYANQSFGMLSQNPHNTGHIWSGGENPFYDNQNAPNSPTEPEWGDMFIDLNAFYDPIAWGHHSNVDRLWNQWQQMHPGVDPDDLTDVMIPWHYTVQELLKISKLGYEYVKSSSYHATDSNMAMTKVSTSKASIPQKVVDQHSKAEVRLHGVQRAIGSHFFRVFINQPDATNKTPTKDNDHYVGYIARFGHGNCIGGPGHCDIPALTRRKYDKRPRHHNTPTNHKLDATKTIQKLRAKGQTEFQVQVVVMSPDGRMAQGQHRALLDGVSLNFFD